MSTPTASRAAPIPPYTLADVLAAIAAAELPAPRKQDLASAVRSAARALGRSPEQVAADPRLLASRLAEIAPQALGFSKARWNNVRSLSRAALELVTAMAPGRHLTPLTRAWEALWDRLPTRTVKTRISRFLHYCSAAGVEPGDVSEATFCAFREHLDQTLLKDPPVVFRETLLGWNAARQQVTDWPEIAMIVPARRTAWTLPWSTFPESLYADAMHYLDRLGGRDLLEELPFRPVRPLTLQHREYQIRQFASALVLRGRDASTLTSLADLVAIDVFKEGLRYLLERRGGKSTATIVHLATSLKAIARHHVRADAQHLERMAAVIARLDPPKRGLNAKNRSRLRALDDPKTALALLQLPAKLMALADRERHALRAARLAQTAVAIEILLMAPIRISNLSTLDVERHLIRPNRTGNALHIVIESSEVKNREPLEYPLPTGSVALIERYLSQFRPTLAPAGSTALFPGGCQGLQARQCSARADRRRGIHAYRHASSSASVPTHRRQAISRGQSRVLRGDAPGAGASLHRDNDGILYRPGDGSCRPSLRCDDSEAEKRRGAVVNPLHFDPDRRGMPVAEWPEPDRALWQAALIPGDLLDEGGVRARYAPETNYKLAKNYGRWLTWLSRQALLDATVSPAGRITPERVKAFIAAMAEVNATGTILARLQALYEMAQVLDPSRDWRWIRHIESRVRARHVPAGRKRDRLVGTAELLAVGCTLVAEAPAQSTDRLRAMQFRDGLIIAVLAARPLRLKNLANLALERSLVRRGEGWWIIIPPEETKTHEPIEVPWPEALNTTLGTYLDAYRPLLCRLRNRWTRPVGAALWVSTHGSPMCQMAVYDTIVGRTETAFGRPINPHLFRDCAATSIAIEDPEHVRIASQMLGHRSTSTTERYYNQAQAIDAARRYQDFLIGLRQGGIIPGPSESF